METDQTPIKREIKTIALWKTTKMDNNDLALKLNESQRFVKNCIAKYKTLVKNQIEARLAERAHNRRVVSDSMIDEINDYWWKNKNKLLTISKIREEVWKDRTNIDLPWHSTLASILRTKLWMSYRTLATRHPKTTQKEHKQQFIEASIVQMKLSQQQIELVYIDEFSLSWRN